MTVAPPTRSAGRQRLRWLAPVGRELPVLGLVAVVTYGASAYATVPWAPVNVGGCEPGAAWLVALGAVAPALVRRWVPSLSLLAAAALFGWFPGTGIALAMMAYGAAWRVRSVRRRVAVMTLAALVPFGIGLHGSEYQWLTTAIVFGVSALVCVIVPAMVRIMLGQRDRLFGALRERATYLEANYRLADSSARLAERSRIAEEMHDLLGHRLSLISLYAGALELGAAQRAPRLADEARLVRGTVFQAMEELRTVLGLLRSGDHGADPGQPDEEIGTAADIGKLVMQSRAAGVPVEFAWSGDDLTGAVPPVRRAVHRVVREGLTNVHRHALGATPSVLVERGPGQVRVSIRNSAHTQRAAAQPPGTGRGLVGVQERVRMLGGAFSAGPLAHGGFELAAVLPLAIGATDAAAPPAQIAPADRAQVPRHRSPRPSPTDRLARTGMAAILAGGMIGAAALVAASLQTVTFASADEAGNNPFADFDAAKLGTARRDLENSLGTGDPLALAAARTIEPARPGQVTDCAYWYIQQDDRPGTIERFCYRSEVLAEKTRFGLTP